LVRTGGRRGRALLFRGAPAGAFANGLGAILMAATSAVEKQTENRRIGRAALHIAARMAPVTVTTNDRDDLERFLADEL